MKRKHMLGTAIAFAAECHAKQTDRGGKAYILHPLRMMFRFVDDEDLMIIAILHDVVEDCDVTIEQLREMGFSVKVINAVIALTRVDGETYEAFIARCGRNCHAVKVKMEDLRDNMDITRLKKVLSKKELDLLKRYSKAYMYLLGRL